MSIDECVCGSTNCNRYNTCKRAICEEENKLYSSVNWHDYGSVNYTNGIVEEEWYCGERGNYAMFEPIEKQEEKIPFPFYYLNQYLRGESDWDSAFDNTMEEVYSLIEDYVAKHLKTNF